MGTIKLKLNRSTCTIDHEAGVPAKAIAALPESQAGSFRHRCAACAYQLGVEDGLRMAWEGQKIVAAQLIKGVHSH